MQPKPISTLYQLGLLARSINSLPQPLSLNRLWMTIVDLTRRNMFSIRHPS